MIDTHTHLNLDPLVENYQKHWQEAQAAGVTKAIIPGVNFESSEKAVAVAAELDNVYPAIGLHPHEAEQLLTTRKTQEIYQWLLEWGSKDEVVAIGECGLDYFRLPEDQLEAKHIKSFQKKLFKLHIKVALELDKPLLIHIRDLPAVALAKEGAQNDAIALLEEHKPKGVLHCFSGDQDYFNRAIKIGLSISYAGNVTFKNAADLQDICKQTPLDKLLLETDAPYLNPQRGKWPNIPGNIAQTYDYVADSLNISHQELTERVSENCQTLFKL